MSASRKKQLRKEQASASMTEKQLKEKKEAKKLKVYTTTFIAVIALVVCIALAIAVVNAVDRSGIIQRNTDAVVIGQHTLSSADLNYYFMESVTSTYQNWTSQYGDMTDAYLQGLFGLDINKPLSQQPHFLKTDISWGQYFAEAAVESAKSTYALYDLAVAADHKLTEEQQKALDTSISRLAYYATVNGFDSLTDYLKLLYGNGSTEESYIEFMNVAALASSYYTAYSESLKYEDAQLRELEKENFNKYSSYDYSVFYMSHSDFLTGGITNEYGQSSYTDEQRADAKEALKNAAAALEKLKINSVESMEKALKALPAYEKTEELAIQKNEHILYNSVSKTLIEWISDSSRKPGDFGLFPNESKTTGENGEEITDTVGYYAVVYEGKDDNYTKLVNARHILIAFQGGTENLDGTYTYSAEEKETAMNAIKAINEEWLKSDKTEETFAALAKEHSDDGSAENGGLYEDIYPYQMVTNFNDWCFDEKREEGDYALIETEFGYHMIYFVSEDPTTYRDYMLENELRASDVAKWYDEITTKISATVLELKHLDQDMILAAN